MKTTIEIPGALFRQAKAMAAHRGISLNDLFRNLSGSRYVPRIVKTSALIALSVTSSNASTWRNTVDMDEQPETLPS